MMDARTLALAVTVAAGLAGVAGFAGGWVTGHWKMEGVVQTIKFNSSQEKLKAVQEANDRIKQLEAQRREVIAHAEQEAKNNAALLAAARADANRLRTMVATTSAVSAATEPSLRDYTVSLGEVFNECVAEYTELAGKADGHATDTQTLKEAWPK